jgi:hypothetical protein
VLSSLGSSYSSFYMDSSMYFLKAIFSLKVKSLLTSILCCSRIYILYALDDSLYPTNMPFFL